MCYQNLRPHRCRHCGTQWHAPDGLDTCADGLAVLQEHGYCAHITKLLHDLGHVIQLRHSTRPLEDMCVECKRAHVREWEAEGEGKVPVGQPP